MKRYVRKSQKLGKTETHYRKPYNVQTLVQVVIEDNEHPISHENTKQSAIDAFKKKNPSQVVAKVDFQGLDYTGKTWLNFVVYSKWKGK